MASKKRNFSQYEALRQENIKKNEEFLNSLGLQDIRADIVELTTATKKKAKDKSYFVEKGNVHDETSLSSYRRSKRLSKQDPEFTLHNEQSSSSQPHHDSKQVNVDITEAASFDEDISRVHITNSLLRKFIDDTNPDDSKLITDEAISHCVHRLLTMSNKRLATRLKVIARAAGGHSHEKLLVSYYALRASGLNELADYASSLLKSLRFI